MMNRRGTANVLALLAVLAGVLAPPATPAYAHAQLVGTTPANGARLDTAPAEIVLRFSERVLLVRDGIRLLDDAGAARPAGPARIDPTGREATLPVPQGLGDGSYVVSWRVVSADSHPIHGAFSFGVGDTRVTPLPDAGAQVTADRGLTTVYWLLRWLGYAGLALLLGGALFLFVCWPAGWAERRARRLLLAGWVTSVLGALGALLIQGPYADGGTLRSVADPGLLSATWGTEFGRFMATRLQLLILAGVLVALLVRRAGQDHRPRWTVWAAGALGAALPLTWIGTGHANAETNPLVWLADAVHLAAMAVWFGGLVFLVAALLSRAIARPVPEVALGVTRFSRIATVCVGLLVVTGTYQAWRGVGSLGALAGSSYGRLLVFKLAVVGVLLWFGWMSRALVHRHYHAQLSTTDTSRTTDTTGTPDTAVPAELAMAGAPPPPASGLGRSAGGGSSRAARGSLSRAARGGQSRSAGGGQSRSAGGGSSRTARRSDRVNSERERLARGKLRWSVWIEVTVGVAVLALTSLLVATPPGARPAAADAAPLTQASPTTRPEVVATQLMLTGGGRLYVQLDPARPGESNLVIAVLDSASKPWDVPEVTATLRLEAQGIGPLPVTLRKIKPGDYASTGLTIPMDGTWQLQVKVRTSEIDQITADATLTVY